MGTIKMNTIKKEIETISSALSSADAQKIFYDIVFRKKVEEGMKEPDTGMASNWNEFKKEMRSWYKSK